MLDSTKLVSALDKALRELGPRVRGKEWADWSMRTHHMKGNAVRETTSRKAVPHKKEYVLARALERLGYHRYQKGVQHQTHVFFHEWRQLDIGVVECDNNWADDCWMGKYTTRLVLEVENDIREFTMTMRGMLDVRAELYCGIFYSDKPRIEEIEVGSGTKEDPPVLIRDWPLPWKQTTSGATLPAGSSVMALFLSSSEPAVRGWKEWTSGAKDESHVSESSLEFWDNGADRVWDGA
ncbi:MAG: hypothetical protein HY720_25890 [Planctomycetes bacterium]|nr:hypothetical protein [Planctomycetota bacterium]